MKELQMLIDILEMEKVRAITDLDELEEDDEDLIVGIKIRVDALTFCIDEARLLLKKTRKQQP